MHGTFRLNKPWNSLLIDMEALSFTGIFWEAESSYKKAKDEIEDDGNAGFLDQQDHT